MSYPDGKSSGRRQSSGRPGGENGSCPARRSRSGRAPARRRTSSKNRPLTGTHVYVWLDAIWLKRSWAGEVRNVSVLVAIGVGDEGYREVLGVQEGMKEDKESWSDFLKNLRGRGLKGTELFVTDKCQGLVESVGEIFPEARWQRCVVHWYRNVLRTVPKTKWREVAAMLKAIHAQEDRRAALRKAHDVHK